MTQTKAFVDGETGLSNRLSRDTEHLADVPIGMRSFLAEAVTQAEHKSLAWGECGQRISQVLHREARAGELKRIRCLRIGDDLSERLRVIGWRRLQTDGRAQQLT